MTDLVRGERLIPSEPFLPLQTWRKQRERWDALAREIPDLLPAPSTNYYRRREIELIQLCFGPLRGKRVLKLDLWNVALNTRILHWMVSQGAEAVGLDFSQKVTFQAHRNSRDVEGTLHLVQSDIRLLPFEDNTFDFVYTMGTMEHIDEYRDAVHPLSDHRHDIRPQSLPVNSSNFAGRRS